MSYEVSYVNLQQTYIIVKKKKFFKFLKNLTSNILLLIDNCLFMINYKSFRIFYI